MKAGKLINRIVYSAEYFGRKNHYDQNKKLGMYGVIHALARNGYTGMIIEFAVMSIKTTNNNTKSS